MNCIKCASPEFVTKSGFSGNEQRYHCKGRHLCFTQASARRLAAPREAWEKQGGCIWKDSASGRQVAFFGYSGVSIMKWMSPFPAKDKHVRPKKETYAVESCNARLRHDIARFQRKTKCCSKADHMVETTLKLAFYKFNYS